MLNKYSSSVKRCCSNNSSIRGGIDDDKPSRISCSIADIIIFGKFDNNMFVQSVSLLIKTNYNVPRWKII